MNESGLSNRLEKLEKRNRLLSLAVILLCLLGVFGFARAQKTAFVVQRAQRFELTDGKGTVKAVLAAKEDESGFYLMDERGIERMALKHNAEGTGLYIRDARQVDRVGVAQFAHGGGGIAIHGEASKGAAVLYYKNHGTLTFYDTEGKIIQRIPTSK